MFVLIMLNILFNSLLLQSDSIKPGPWEKKNVTDDGIAIYSREYPNTNVREIKAVCKIKATPLKVFNVVLDRNTFSDLNKYLVEYKRIRTEKENVWYVYQRVSVPLVKDRDYTHRYEATRDTIKNKYFLTWQIDNRNGPSPIEDVIRIELSRGSLTISPAKNGNQSIFIYQMLFDPGGSIPKWIVNLTNRYTLPKVLRTIREKSLNQH